MKSAVVTCLLPVLAVAPLAVAFHPDPPSAAGVGRAARAFLASLDAGQRAKACFPFTDGERQKWHFVPGIYPGVALQDLDAAQKRGVHRLLRSVLSGSGYGKTTAIMKLEDTLRRLAEASGGKADHRDPGRYSVAIFGEPGGDRPWGFRVQGHHVSFNFTIDRGRVVATTPAFLGANPAEVRRGAHAGLRALPEEEDLAFELLGSLDDGQRQQAVLGDKAPADVLWGPGKGREVLGGSRGLGYGAMTEAQRELLWRLIRVYVGNLDHDLAAAELRRIEAAGRDGIHFAWIGSLAPGKGHYYRITGSGFAIEYDNTQNGANHVHVVWHDADNDFGLELLRRHHEQQHKK